MVTKMEDLQLLHSAELICDQIWTLVSAWNRFEKETVGTQLVRAVDSIGANIAESYGRFNYGEKIQFLYYSRGSIYETKFWLRRCTSRALIQVAVTTSLAQQLEDLARTINTFVASLKTQRTETRRS
jgi:four helix bundle protein